MYHFYPVGHLLQRSKERIKGKYSRRLIAAEVGSLTLTGAPSLGIIIFLGSLQKISFSRIRALQFTPFIVMMMSMQWLTKLSLSC